MVRGPVPDLATAGQGQVSKERTWPEQDGDEEILAGLRDGQEPLRGADAGAAAGWGG